MTEILILLGTAFAIYLIFRPEAPSPVTVCAHGVDASLSSRHTAHVDRCPVVPERTDHGHTSSSSQHDGPCSHLSQGR